MQQESGREKKLICLEGTKDSFTEEVDNQLRRDRCSRTGRAGSRQRGQQGQRQRPERRFEGAGDAVSLSRRCGGDSGRLS